MVVAIAIWQGVRSPVGDRMFIKQVRQQYVAVAVVGVVGMSLAVCSARQADAIDSLSVDLSRCEATFAYVINLFLLLNNEGATKVMAIQMARVTATNFMRNNDGDKVPVSAVQEMKAAQRGVKFTLDQHPEDLVAELDRCQQRVSEIYSAEAALGRKLFGLRLDELAVRFAEDTRKAVGLR